jgi:hypothetical protein
MGSDHPEFVDAVYAATHGLYVLTNYRKRRLPAGNYADESRLIRIAVSHAIAVRDVELLGEALEATRILRVTLPSPVWTKALTFIRGRQRSDGGWASSKADAYTRYHATWTCLDALRPHEPSPMGVKDGGAAESTIMRRGTV